MRLRVAFFAFLCYTVPKMLGSKDPMVKMEVC